MNPDSKFVSFGPDTWAKGTRGLTGAHATDMPKLQDCMLYRDGSLGPRPKWQTKLLTETDADFPSDETLFFACPFRYIDTYYPGFIFIGPNQINWYDEAGTLFAQRSGAGSGVPGVTTRSKVTRIDTENWLVDNRVITLYDPGVSFVPHTIGAATVDLSVFGTINVYGSTIHQGRSFFWGLDVSFGFQRYRNRVWYSDAYDYDLASSALQYFDVDGNIAGLVSLGSTLAIWTEQGDWYALQGVGNPANATLSKIGPQRIPPKLSQATRVDQTALFYSSDGMVMCTMDLGGEVDDLSLERLGINRSAYNYSESGTTPRMSANSLLNTITAPKSPLHNVLASANGVWYEEQWGMTTYGIEPQVSSDANERVQWVAIYDSGLSGWGVFKREMTIDQPEDPTGFAETLTSTITLPRITMPDATLRVTQVVLDIRSYSPDTPAPVVSVSVADGHNVVTAMTTGPAVPPFSGVLGAYGQGRSHRIAAFVEPLSFTHFSDIAVSFSGLVIERISVEYQVSPEGVLVFTP